MRRAWLGLVLALGCAPKPPPPPPAAPDPFAPRARQAGLDLRRAAAPADQDRWAAVCVSYAADPNPQVSGPALDALRDHVQASLRRAAGERVVEAVDALRRAGRPEAPGLFRDVLASRLPAWVRADALRRLAAEAGPGRRRLLLDALDDPDIRDMAAVELGLDGPDPSDPELLRRLVAAGEATPRIPGVYPWAVRAVGGDDARPVLARWLDRLDGWARTDAAWVLADVDPWTVPDRLVALGVLPSPPRVDALNATIGSRQAGPHPVSRGVVSLAFEANGRLARIVRHRLDEPLDYPARLRDVANASRGLFAPANVRLEGPDVLFDDGSRAFRFTPRDLGDLRDVDALRAAVNRALEDRGVPERFIDLEEGGPLAEWGLAAPDRLRAAARALSLPLAK